MRRALLVDDDPASLAALAELIEREGFTATTAATVAEARARIDDASPDVVLTDLMLPDGRGLELVEVAARVGAQVVLITGHASVETAVEALRRGATDCLTKPVDAVRLKTMLANLARTRALQAEIGSLRRELRTLGRCGPLVGPAEVGTTLAVHVGSSAAAVERRLILATLEACGGNKQKAAELLGVSLKTIYNRLNAYRERRRGAATADAGGSLSDER